MTTRFVHRRDDDSIASAHEEPQPGYAEEALDDQSGELAAWLAAALAPPVLSEVTSGQFIQAPAELDLLDSVDAAVAQADALTQRLWARASRFVRADPMIVGVASALGKTSEDLDQIFRLAAAK